MLKHRSSLLPGLFIALYYEGGELFPLAVGYLHMTGFCTGFFLGKGNVDSCEGCMHPLVHPLGFYEILDTFKRRNIRSV